MTEICDKTKGAPPHRKGAPPKHTDTTNHYRINPQDRNLRILSYYANLPQKCTDWMS